jgi:aminoglycoside phosphotransferase (APT) family kinase protein
MIEIDSQNLADYLTRRGWLDAGDPAEVQALAGGVSNVVFRVSSPSRGEIVIKQSRGQLRTRAAWFSRLERIFREIDMLRALAPLLPERAVPRVLFEDRENFLFAMQAAPAAHIVWKAELLSGNADPKIAAALGEYLSTVHCRTAGDPRLRSLLGDRTVFDELRIDPFYRYVAAAHDDLRPPLARLIERMEAEQLSAVHADFSPKNVLVTRDPSRAGGEAAIMLVDFETGHYGDPAFDLGFFLSHLLLKAVRFAERSDEYMRLATTFWDRYREGFEANAPPALRECHLEGRSVLHLGACMLARIDGKSPVDYLTRDDDRELVRRFCRRLILEPPTELRDVFIGLKRDLNACSAPPKQPSIEPQSSP